MENAFFTLSDDLHYLVLEEMLVDHAATVEADVLPFERLDAAFFLQPPE